MKIRLYHYWRSSSSWRVRWAFAHKGIECELVAVNLLSDEPESDAHRARNPLGLVPVLEFPDEPSSIRYIGESMAIIQWAESMRPSPTLFPGSALEKARAVQLAEIINSGTQPLQNLGVATVHSSDPEKQLQWNQHWIRRGLGAYETLVRETAGTLSIGDQLSVADLFLIPQCYNAARFHINVAEEFPLLGKIQAGALATESAKASSPERYQPQGT
jgi:maleylacetoacetate isomerase